VHNVKLQLSEVWILLDHSLSSEFCRWEELQKLCQRICPKEQSNLKMDELLCLLYPYFLIDKRWQKKKKTSLLITVYWTKIHFLIYFIYSMFETKNTLYTMILNKKRYFKKWLVCGCHCWLWNPKQTALGIQEILHRGVVEMFSMLPLICPFPSRNRKLRAIFK